MKIFIYILPALLTISCLEDINLKNASLDKAVNAECSSSLPTKCIFDENNLIVNDLSIEILKDDKDKEYGFLCVNVSDNAKHCGSCGFECEGMAHCVDGKCEKKCDRNEKLNDAGECYCPGFEGEYNTNEHCGACGKKCGEGSSCEQNGDKFQCLCSDTTNLDTNVEHCGQCGNNCNFSVLNASPIVCVRGSCNYIQCEKNYIDLDQTRSNGCESEPSEVNVKYMTSDGEMICVNHYKDCNDNRIDGCETSLNAQHTCGDCNIDCDKMTVNVDAPLCKQGRCDYGACKANFGDCDKNRTNGCETNVVNHINHCGTCGNNCSVAVKNANEISCINGKCDYKQCKDNFFDCDKNRLNGCEINIKNDINNCGGCGIKCSVNLKNTDGVVCNNGKCDYKQCKENFFDCDKNRLNGCEINIKNDINHCGVCGTKCSDSVQFAEGIACFCGKCDFLKCQENHFDIDGNRTNGCEVSLEF